LVLCLVVVFLWRQESVLYRQYELRAEASANAIASESQFALLVGDTADLKRMAQVAVAGSEDVLYMVVEDSSAQPIASAYRNPLTAGTVPGRAGGKTNATRRFQIGTNPDIECIEVSVPVIAQSEGEFFGRCPDPQPVLGRVRLGMSLQARRATLISSMRYAAGIGLLLILAGSVAAYFHLRQKRAEAISREAEERLSFLVSLSPAVLYSGEFQNQLRMTFVADNVREVLGYDPEQFAEAEFFRSHLHSEDRARAETTLEEMRRSGQQICEYRLLHSDGKYRWVQDHRKIVSGSSGEPAQLVGLLFDITKTKLLEAQLQQAQKLESIGQLAAGLAHEINTPIQYVGDNTRFLEEAFGEMAGLFEASEAVVRGAANGGVTKKLLDQVNQACEKADIAYLREEIPKAIEQSLEGVARVTQIVKAMKEFSHPGPVTLTAVDLNREIESTILVCRNEWKYVSEMVTEFDAELPAVPCLPGEMKQVILNLLMNASQAIADVVKKRGGKGAIKVSTRRDGEWAEVRIQDTGGGISAAIRTKVFDPFFTTKDVGKGTGQGLALAHSVVVQKHRGSITFETEEGIGTVFIIRLPLTESARKS
jgi:PAS domain S-box-containing protein